jgi:hypothetical protein
MFAMTLSFGSVWIAQEERMPVLFEALAACNIRFPQAIQFSQALHS